MPAREPNCVIFFDRGDSGSDVGYVIFTPGDFHQLPGAPLHRPRDRDADSQLLAAGFIGAAFYARQFARRAKGLFSKKHADEAAPDQPTPDAVGLDESSSDLAKKAK